MTPDQIADRIEEIQAENKKVIDELIDQNNALWGCFGMPFDDMMIRHAEELAAVFKQIDELIED